MPLLDSKRGQDNGFVEVALLNDVELDVEKEKLRLGSPRFNRKKFAKEGGSPNPVELKGSGQVVSDPKTKAKKQNPFFCSKMAFGVLGIVILALILTATLITYFTLSKSTSRRPHILLLLADDLGWGDVGWHSSEIKTPTLSKLAKEGVRFNHFYTQPICTASRAALLTGRYPFKLGLQGSRPILAGSRSSLPLDERLFSQDLKRVGYRTHLVGKWHLGFEAVEYTPVSRGFDTFTGFYNGMQDYYHHTTSGFDTIDNVGGYDMRRDVMDKDGVPHVDNMLWNANGTHNNIIFTNEAIRIIREHVTDYKGEPLFLMMSYPNPHTPIQVPEKFVEANSHIRNPIRRKYAGLVSSMDDSVKQILEELKSAKLLDETLILFLSDNGGAYMGHSTEVPTGSTNFPLRGMKGSLWEGGNRVPAFINGPGIPKEKIMDEVIHITDVYPSLMKMLDIDINKDNLDGTDLSPLFQMEEDSKTRKNYFIYDIDPVYRQAGIRKDNWKLIVGNSSLRQMNHWFPPLVENESRSSFEVMNISTFLNEAFRQIKIYHNSRFCKSIKCFFPIELDHEVQLFDLQKDEYEFNNVAGEHANVVEDLVGILNKEMEAMIPPVNLLQKGNARANPHLFNGTWHPWMTIT